MKKKILYFENLDGLRFLCFLSVFLFHGFFTNYDYIKNSSTYIFVKRGLFSNGNIGVNFFFVLSGFLITFLLIVEKQTTTRIHIYKFWLRRILRIWPLYFFCVLFGFVAFPIFKRLFGQIPNETANPWFYIAFINNFDFIKHGPPDASVLGVLWSIAVEEQFYFIWPIILFLVPLKKLWIPFLIIISGSLIFRAYNDTLVMHEYHTASCVGDMTIGALGAWFINVSEKFKHKIENLSASFVYLLYVIFLLIFFFRTELLSSTYAGRIFERMIIAIVILFIILEQCYSNNSIVKMSKFKLFSKLGVISYGLYCLHFIGILITINITRLLGINNTLWDVLLLESAMALLITILLSIFSYNFYEKPFLRLKERFAYITRK
jgi:peptidoglycan/LPS O-acetylase OafA/YrhL